MCREHCAATKRKYGQPERARLGSLVSAASTASCLLSCCCVTVNAGGVRGGPDTGREGRFLPPGGAAVDHPPHMQSSHCDCLRDLHVVRGEKEAAYTQSAQWI